MSPVGGLREVTRGTYTRNIEYLSPKYTCKYTFPVRVLMQKNIP